MRGSRVKKLKLAHQKIAAMGLIPLDNPFSKYPKRYFRLLKKLYRDHRLKDSVFA